MSKENDEYAFPRADQHFLSGSRGMTLRDYFAAKAMNGIISAVGTQDGLVEYDERQVASSAYMMADAMLAERDK